MHFKKLELIGFKSFLERTKLYFEPGITTIVGPNGCGKSNIIDAIKWVLGEQSARSLRGSKMEDVIFSGTDEKEPINMAEVSLTLSNRDKLLPIDADEVVVSRRLFRSGESEYLINKTPVRLKDVSELFMGTGIGAEAYSMIEQGKIDLILSSRPEERRFIFEEASGITKYKSKKKEAIRKLEATDNNLLRVSDIITEVKRQINSITRQANKAERYKERFERLKDIETKVASYGYDMLKQEKEKIQAKSTKAIDEISSMSAEIGRLQKELESEKDSLARIDEKFAEMQNGKISKESTIEHNENRIDVNRERITELSIRVDGLKNEIKSIDKRKENSQILIQELENKFSAVSDNEEAKRIFRQEKEKRLEELESGIERGEKDIEESRQRLVDYMAERSRSKNEIVRLTSDIQNRSVRLRRLNLELNKVTGETDLVQKKLTETKKEFKDIESALDNIRLDADKLKEDREEQLSSLNSLEDELKKKRETLITLESKKSFLEDLINRHEGFTGGAKALLEPLERGDLKIDGIKGVLGDMVEAAKGYEIAVEAALGNYVQCVVSEDREGALKAIQYLSTNKKGQATFIISSELSMDEERDTATLSLDSIQGKLTDFVDAKDGLRSVIVNLLKKTYLVETMEAVHEILNNRDVGDEIRLVTKRGEILKKGFITAGSSPESGDAGIIGRRTRLKSTIDNIELSKSTITRMEKEREDLNARIVQFDEKLDTIYSLLKKEEAKFHKKESELASVEQENNRLEEEISLLKLEIDEVTEETKELSNKKNGLEKSLSDMESEENNTQSVILNLQESAKESSKEREETIVLIAEIKTELQAFSKEKVSLSQSLEVQRELFQTYTNSLTQKQNEIDASSRKKDELTQEIEELETEMSKLSAEVKLMDEELVQIGINKKRSSSIIGDSGKRLNDLYKTFDGRKDAEHKMEMRNSEVNFKIETLKNRIVQMYKVDIDVARPEYDSSIDWETARREIEELKRKLDSMGTVNLVAIEERKELEDRFNFLNHQQEDLLKAKESLQKAITKINKTTRKLFIETFEKIQFEFKNYFRYLFGGGQAEIYLLDERDVLESGIEIAVRPPGKKLQSISLLSGGEKALTAIALIFAIFKVKPSPFCLLDEVDAPLDESNIVRFSKALREFTKKSQFIVITHNKRTITLADVMYGITMEKSGISKIVSVKFHDEMRTKKAIPGKTEDEREKEEGVLA